ncbi:hypothetical protein [Ornithinibacillus sp. FSL M8-0202]
MDRTVKKRKRKPGRNFRATYSIELLVSNDTKERLFKIKGAD